METLEPTAAASPPPTFDTRRWPYLAAMAFAGAAAALLAYRFLVLPLTWSSNKSFVFPGLSMGLAFGARSLLQDRQPRRWPAIPLVVASLIGGALAAAAIAFAVSPPLSRIHLKTRVLPGFSIDLPSGDTKEKPSSYAAGSIHVLDVGGTGAVAAIDWEPGGRLDKDQLQMVGRTLSGSNQPGTITSRSLDGTRESGGPGVVETLTLASDKGEIRMTALPCGVRHVIVMTVGDHSEKLHGRMLASFRCTSDPSQETIATRIGIGLELPGWWKVSEEGPQIRLTDGQSLVILQAGGVTTGPLKALLEKGFGALGKVTASDERADGLVPFEVAIDKERALGFLRQVMCPPSSTLVMLMSPDQASLDRWASKIVSPRCLGPGEPAQQWPAAPAPQK